jgi:hypothetical protein
VVYGVRLIDSDWHNSAVDLGEEPFDLPPVSNRPIIDRILVRCWIYFVYFVYLFE